MEEEEEDEDEDGEPDGPTDKPIAPNGVRDSLRDASRRSGSEQQASGSDHALDHSRQHDTIQQVLLDLARRHRALTLSRANIAALEENCRLARKAVDNNESYAAQLEEIDPVEHAAEIAEAEGKIVRFSANLADFQEQLETADIEKQTNGLDRGELLELVSQKQIHLEEEIPEELAGIHGTISRYAGKDNELGYHRTLEGNRMEDLDARERRARMCIRDIDYQNELDAQLQRLDSETIELRDGKAARYEGILAAIQVRRDLATQSIADADKVRERADDVFCNAIDAFLTGTGMIEPNPYAVDQGSDREDDDTGHRGSSRGPSASPVSPERSRKAELKADKVRARRDLAEAQERYDTLRQSYDQSLRKERSKRGSSFAQSEFDRQELRVRTGLIGKIVSAEKALKAAKLALRDAGVVPSIMASSVFPDRPDDGYAESVEEAQIARLDKGKLETWLNNVEEKEKAEQKFPMPDDAESLNTADRHALIPTWESLSVVAAGRRGERLQDWKDVQERDRRDVEPYMDQRQRRRSA